MISHRKHRRAHSRRAIPAVVALIAAPELLGGAPPWAAAAIALLVALALGTTAWRSRAQEFRWTHTSFLLVAILVGTAILTAIQAIPLPIGLVDAVQPLAADSVRRTATLLGHGEPGWATLSIDPGATRREVIDALASIGAVFLGLTMAQIGRRRLLLIALALSVLVMALVGLGHELATAQRLFGLYEPRYADPPVLAPLLNPNHLAGFLAMGLPVLIALAVRSDARGRVLWSVGAVLVATVVAMALSRGGLAAAAGGAVLIAGMIVTGRDRAGRRRSAPDRFRWAAAAVVALGVAAGVYVAADEIATDWREGELDKSELWGDAAGLAIHHPAIGIGKGATAAILVAEHGTERRYEYVESLPLQWSLDWGMLPAAALFVAIALAIGAALRNRRSTVQTAAAIGLLAILIQNCADFSLELPGVAVPFFAVLGAVVPTRPSWSAPVGFRCSLAPVTAAVAAGALLLGPAAHRQALEQMTDQLAQDLEQRDADQFAAVLEDALSAHPGEPAFALLAGREALERGDPSAPLWLNRAMELAPPWDVPHLEAARWLWRQGRTKQAMLEVRQAAQRSLSRAAPFACRVVNRTHDPSHALAAAPDGPARAAFLDRLGSCTQGHPEVRSVIDAALLQEDPNHVGGLLRCARHAVQERNWGEAEALLDRATAAAPDDPRVRIGRASFLIASGQPAKAVEHLASYQPLDPRDRAMVLRMRARAQARAGDLAAMHTTLDQLRGLAAGSPEGLARVMRLQAELEEERGNFASALHALEEAHRFSSDPKDLAEVASMAVRLGDRRRAYAAYRALCRLGRQHACREAEQLRSP